MNCVIRKRKRAYRAERKLVIADANQLCVVLVRTKLASRDWEYARIFPGSLRTARKVKQMLLPSISFDTYVNTCWNKCKINRGKQRIHADRDHHLVDRMSVRKNKPLFCIVFGAYVHRYTFRFALHSFYSRLVFRYLPACREQRQWRRLAILFNNTKTTANDNYIRQDHTQLCERGQRNCIIYCRRH